MRLRSPNKPFVVSRRQFLVASAVGVTTTLMGTMACGRMAPGPCARTPPQTEGPFYPIDDQLDEDNDLTFVLRGAGRAEGQIIYVRGQVMDDRCQPVQGARVEIWQASSRGRYNHRLDRNNPVPLDPNFQGWGEVVTDREGRYLFKTIHPGQYPATPGWIRPSHIHFKVVPQGARALTTQMYFAGDPYLEQDRIFLYVPASERERVVVRPEEPGSEFEKNAIVYSFNLTV